MRFSQSCGSKALVAVAIVLTACANAADRPVPRPPSPQPKIIVSLPTREVEDRLDELDRKAAELDAATKRWGANEEVATGRVQNGIGSSSKGL